MHKTTFPGGGRNLCIELSHLPFRKSIWQHFDHPPRKALTSRAGTKLDVSDFFFLSTRAHTLDLSGEFFDACVNKNGTLEPYKPKPPVENIFAITLRCCVLCSNARFAVRCERILLRVSLTCGGVCDPSNSALRTYWAMVSPKKVCSAVQYTTGPGTRHPKFKSRETLLLVVFYLKGSCSLTAFIHDGVSLVFKYFVCFEFAYDY